MFASSGHQVQLADVSRNAAERGKRVVEHDLATAVEAEAVLATNTSSYDINWFADLVAAPQRVISTHWYNPAPIVSCVEVIPGDATDPAVVEGVVAPLEGLGKEPAAPQRTWFRRQPPPDGHGR